MLGTWFKARHRRRIQRIPTPPSWEDWIANSVRFYQNWRQPTQTKLLDIVKILVAEKHWEGCNGLEINDEVKVVISAHAATMLLGVANYYFDGVKTILVHPQSFRREMSNGLTVDLLGLAGQAFFRGPILLSWRDIVHRSAGQNLVIHEFAHHLDYIDGYADGMPIFSRMKSQSRWKQVARKEYDAHVFAVSQGRNTFLDPYGALNPAEFFAVVSETFFEMGSDLARNHPEIFALLCELYNVDPRTWQD